MQQTKLLLIILLILSFGKAKAQDTILVKKNFFGTRYTYKNTDMNFKDLAAFIKDNPETIPLMQKARNNQNAVHVFNFIGGFLMGWPVGTAIGGGKPEWSLALAGVGVSLISIPYSISAHKQAREAVRIYNQGLASSSIPSPVWKINFALQGTGIKAFVNF